MSIWITEDSYDYNVKIIVLGDSNVGKTNIIKRYIKNSYDPNLKNTIGVDFFNKETEYKNKKINIQLWDTAGQEKFKSLTNNCFKFVSGIILVFDLTNELSWENINNWYNDIINNIPEDDIKNIEIICWGNKSDLNDKIIITENYINNFLSKFNIKYYEVSAKTNENNCIHSNIDSLIDNILNKINIIPGTPKKPIIPRRGIKPTNNKCC